ncbi:ABC transporter permease [Methanocaldococcus sp.]
MKRVKYIFALPLVLFSFLLFLTLFTIISSTSLDNIVKALLSKEVQFSVLLTLKCSVIAIILALIVGIPSGYYLARYDFKFKSLVDSLINLPILLPPLVLGFGLLLLFGNTSIGNFVSNFIPILFTPNGIILAQFVIATPFIIRTTKAVFEGIDVKYEYIAQSLGLSKLETFFKISLPMAKSGIIAGIILGWARAIGEFGATLMLAGATRFKTETLPIAIFLNVSICQIDLALAIAIIHIAIAIIIILLVKLIGDYCEC